MCGFLKSAVPHIKKLSEVILDHHIFSHLLLGFWSVISINKHPKSKDHLKTRHTGKMVSNVIIFMVWFDWTAGRWIEVPKKS